MNSVSDRPLNVAIIGAGVRGTWLSRKLKTSVYSVRIVAVAEPDKEKRIAFAKEFALPESSCYEDWKDLISGAGECDSAIIATMDNQHAGPAVGCLERGWHILTEKPLADTPEDCRRIAGMAEEKGKTIAVCHTLRFMESFRKLKEKADSGIIGRIVHIEHMEAIGHLRFAHNYVRGRWARKDENTFLLLHKCSHDIDFLIWLKGNECKRVSSFGSLYYFKPENAPEGSTYRCTGGCFIEDRCPYSAVKIYAGTSLDEWPARDICRTHTKAGHLNAIRNGPYGVCVWKAGNDVVDHQTVLMEFEDGATATCTLSGFSPYNGRRIRVQGTLGEILFDEAAGTITTRLFGNDRDDVLITESRNTYHPEDQDIIDEWISSIRFSTGISVDAWEAFRTLSVVFAAEKSRIENRTIELSGLPPE